MCNKSSFDWDLWRNGLISTSHPYVNESVLVNKHVGSGASIAATHKRDYRRLLSQLGFPARIINRTTAFSTTAEYNQRYNLWACLAYNRIWWDWYRDSNLIDDTQKANYIDEAVSGSNTLTHFEPRYVCFPKDYFTTAKVSPQVGGSSCINASGSASMVSSFNPKNVLNSSGDILVGSNTAGYSIQFLRAANSLQRYLERNNIAGGRVMARYLARFGVTPDSVRLDQSEYVGGFIAPLNIGEVTSRVAFRLLLHQILVRPF